MKQKICFILLNEFFYCFNAAEFSNTHLLHLIDQEFSLLPFSQIQWFSTFLATRHPWSAIWNFWGTLDANIGLKVRRNGYWGTPNTSSWHPGWKPLFLLVWWFCHFVCCTIHKTVNLGYNEDCYYTNNKENYVQMLHQFSRL